MRNRILVTEGQGEFVQTVWRKPKHKANEISVKAVMTGICRSDIDMMEGKFGPLPLTMQGHEGLAQVVEVGAEIDRVQPGDYVATRGEPAFSDHYNVRRGEFVKVPTADPKYIVEPVACGMNVVLQAMPMIRTLQGAGSRMLILGSGFLAYIAYQTIKMHELEFEMHVVGKSNKDKWHGHLSLDTKPRGRYDVIIDLKDDMQVIEKNLLKPGGVWVLASEKKQTYTTNFGPMLWNATNIICPSPRVKSFYATMDAAVRWIEEGKLDVSGFWTKGYDRDTEWQKAFTDGLYRPKNYSRGYLTWR
jgi:D-arabinose 1-dehydrogenase-like Zn-dependent alcohol dehydrogenase